MEGRGVADCLKTAEGLPRTHASNNVTAPGIGMLKAKRLYQRDNLNTRAAI
ncbi:hypothetical protein ACVJMZ_000018 [Sinorhizobium medicae]